MQRSPTFRFTPARLLVFLTIPALLLGGAFIASGRVLGGTVILVVSAVAIFANLAMGAVATLLGRLLHRRFGADRRSSSRQS
jgi:hypothetical protein